jgi:hypothetical protein
MHVINLTEAGANPLPVFRAAEGGDTDVSKE